MGTHKQTIKYEYKCNHCGYILYNLPIYLENGSYIDFSANCANCNGLKPFTLHQIIQEPDQDSYEISDIEYITAIRVVRQELKKDQDPGSTFHGWQSNLACIIADNSDLSMEKSNEIAIKFLERLID